MSSSTEKEEEKSQETKDETNFTSDTGDLVEAGPATSGMSLLNSIFQFVWGGVGASARALGELTRMQTQISACVSRCRTSQTQLSADRFALARRALAAAQLAYTGADNCVEFDAISYRSTDHTPFWTLAVKGDALHVGFRGTRPTSTHDILVDLYAKPSEPLEKQLLRLHDGMAKTMRSAIDELVRDISAKRTEGMAVHVSGHSLGGALAIMFVLLLGEASESEHQKILENIQSLITFGAPQCVQGGVDVDSMPSWPTRTPPFVLHVVNNSDIVPRLLGSLAVSKLLSSCLRLVVIPRGSDADYEALYECAEQASTMLQSFSHFRTDHLLFLCDEDHIVAREAVDVHLLSSTLHFVNIERILRGEVTVSWALLRGCIDHHSLDEGYARNLERLFSVVDND